MARKKLEEAAVSTTTLISNNPKSIAAEAYRTLRTNIQFYDVGEPVKRLMVTSAGPGEGKSTTLANLAISFTQNGSKVILVDADLRRPTAHKRFEVSNLRGVTDVLTGKSNLEQALQNTHIEGLRILTCGSIPPNPSEMLGSKKMRELIDSLAGMADIVLIDAPPVLAVTDAAVLATAVDGVLLVAWSGQVSREMAQKAKAQLEAVRARILGVVLNGIKIDGSQQHYYNYYEHEKKA